MADPGPSPPQPYQQGPYSGAYPPPPPVPYAGGYSPPPTGPKNGLGIASLVIAILALLTFLSVGGGIIGGIVAVIIGFVARGRVKRGEATNGGVATAGIVLGFLAILAGIVAIVIWIVVFQKLGTSGYVDCMQAAGQNQQEQRQCENQFRDRVENQFGVTLTPTP